MPRRMLLVVLTAGAVGGCGGGDRRPEAPDRGPADTMRLTSPAVRDGGQLPGRHTCDGADTPPPLAWSPPPDGNGQLAIVMHDEDDPRGELIHWVLVELPPRSGRLFPPRMPARADRFLNSFGSRGYRGPCPPVGDKPHRYVFTLYALSERPAISPDTRPREAETAIVRAASVQGSLSVVYGR